MGGCYSATKGMKKENGLVPEPQAAKEDIVPKVADELLPKEETTLEVTKNSKFETMLKEDVTCEVSSPKEETTSEVVVASSKEETTPKEVAIALLPNKETTTSEVVTLTKKEDVIEVTLPPMEEVITNEVVVPEDETVSTVTMTNVIVEAPMKNDESCDVKETKKEKNVEEEIKDGEKVVMDESKVIIEKMTLEAEETGPKGEEAKAVASKESEKECEAVEEQKTDKQSPAA